MIAHCPVAPPVHVPHLMPFSHTVLWSSTCVYLRIQPAPLLESHPCFPPSAVAETHLASTSTAVESTEENEKAPAVTVVTATAEIKMETDSDTKQPSSKPPRPGPIERLSGSAKRFISSFRGRTVHGVEVPLPKGYSGLVLRGDAEGRTQTTTSSKAKRRPGRILRRQAPEGVPEDDDMEGILPPEEDRPVKVLKPSARFDSFVLWHPDLPVDEEMDEYLRSLSEWVNTASEVRLIRPIYPTPHSLILGQIVPRGGITRPPFLPSRSGSTDITSQRMQSNLPPPPHRRYVGLRRRSAVHDHREVTKLRLSCPVDWLHSYTP